MAEFPAFPLWTDAYLSDTGDLTTLEHGAYMLMLMAMWRAGGTLPNDDAKLRKVTRLDARQWPKVKPILMSLLMVTEQHVSSKRLTRELHAARSRSEKAAASARAKVLKEQAPPPANALPEHSLAAATTSITTSTTSSLRSDERARAPNPSVVLQGAVDGLTAQAFVAHCEEKRKPLSSQQAEAIAGVLRDVKALGGNPAEALRLAVRKGWVTLELEYLRNNGFPLPKTAPAVVSEAVAQWPLEKWRLMVTNWQQTGDWNPSLGPKPGEPGCRVPPELLKDAA
jgi:uncharacterized protein YdaU (DUF1376 family)